MNILNCNVGSTSLKFKLYRMPEQALLAEGKVERVGSSHDAIYHYANPDKGFSARQEGQSVPDYATGIRRFLGDLTSPEAGAVDSVGAVDVVGFKTVLAKGFSGVHLLTDEVMEGMAFYMGIAGSHNGPYMAAIEQFRKLLPGAKLVGSFETGFHQTIPLHRSLYGLPFEWYERFGIRRMGYHGASHGYIAGRMAGEPGGCRRLVSCHLGGSSSLCAVLDGKSVDTSFGISLQTGIPHANRSGDTDTCLVPFLLSQGLSLEEIGDGLAKKGGLLGISGVSGDMRHIEQAVAEGSERARLAVDVYCTAIIRYIGAYYAELGGLDALVFTGGIGENSALVREQVCAPLAHMGVRLDREANQSASGEAVISAADSPVQVRVLPTNEEVEVAGRVYRYLASDL